MATKKKVKKIVPKTRMPRFPKGYTNLHGNPRPKVYPVKCYICGANCTFAWDTVYGLERFSYCSPECIEVHLKRREDSYPIRELAKTFNGRITGTVSKEEIKKLKEIEELMESYKDKYGIYPPVENMGCVPIGFLRDDITGDVDKSS
jgi:hypothetical protein